VARDRGDDRIEASAAALADVPGQDPHLPHPRDQPRPL
jgi:hypothetical protein